ncbi:AIPR family protein [Streptomyces sp. CSMPJR101]|uniref:AIPR family protein n=1 Tax=Streptomyces sp. CSMPJR101 TaxID=1279378 RepID=UPI003853358D
MTGTRRVSSENSIALKAARQVEQGLRKIYVTSKFLATDDLAELPDHEREPREISRALAAQAVRIAAGFGPQEAAATVIDGKADQGIDAIAVVDWPQPHVYLIQAKWSQFGRAKSERDAVLELLTGLRLIDDEEFTEFNPRGRQLAEYAKDVMSRGPVPVTQVVVLMREDATTAGFDHALSVGEREFNRYGSLLDHRIILAKEVWDSVLRDLAPRPVTLTADLFPWFGVTTPYESYQGVIQASQIAQWAEHGADLFNLNIRNPLGRTPINNSLINTLTDEPDSFWYFNNGITVLCESVEKAHQSMRAPQQRPLVLTLRNASVVNGAQTVRAIVEAVASDAVAEEAQVGIRVIVTGREKEFAKQITQATNRQNRVEARDFIALDPVQASLMEEMRAELGLEYSLRRGELNPPEEAGCSVAEAACALACSHKNSQYAARIAATLDVLWERGSQGIHDVLFRPQPSPYQVWNSVLVLRAVRRTLLSVRPRYEGRGAAVTEHGVYLIAHLVFRLLAEETIEQTIDETDPNLRWAARAAELVPEFVRQLVPLVATAIDDLFTERSRVQAVCGDVDRCRDLVAHVLKTVSGTETPAVPDKYLRSRATRKKRRPNAVSVLVDRAVLEEGAGLRLALVSAAESEAVREWLEENPRRGRATWVNHRSRPILWAADGKQYSPTGLVTQIWDLAGWEKRPVANQGTARWITDSGDTLAQLARRELDALEDGLDDLSS